MKRLVLFTSVAVSILAGCGTDAPSAVPTPSPASQSPSGNLGGVVEFQLDGASATTTVDGVADGAGISGTVVTTNPTGTHSVRLECASRDGDTWAVAGTVEQSTMEASSVGDWSAVIVQDGSPQHIGIWMSDAKSEGSDCAGWLEAIDLSEISAEDFLEPVESGELAPPA